MEKTSCIAHVKCKEMLHNVKEERTSYIQQNEGRTTVLVTSCVGTAFYNMLLKETYRKEGTVRRGRRRKQLPNDLKEKRSYRGLKEEALDRSLLRTRCGKGYGLVERETSE